MLARKASRGHGSGDAPDGRAVRRSVDHTMHAALLPHDEAREEVRMMESIVTIRNQGTLSQKRQ